ncbi:unnamed protein product, partial [Ectocarpus sp. 4 AP-2014]
MARGHTDVLCRRPKYRALCVLFAAHEPTTRTEVCRYPPNLESAFFSAGDTSMSRGPGTKVSRILIFFFLPLQEEDNPPPEINGAQERAFQFSRTHGAEQPLAPYRCCWYHAPNAGDLSCTFRCATG